jgi:hypothetical protein
MSYEPMRFGRAFLLAMFVLFAVVGVFMVVALIADESDSPPTAFTALWLLAMGWNAYWWLLRFAVRLDLDDHGYLTWTAPLRSGRLHLTDLIEVRPMRFASNVEVFVSDGHRPILTVATKGLRAFTEEIARQRPDLPVRLGWQARFMERLPGRSRFDR